MAPMTQHLILALAGPLALSPTTCDGYFLTSTLDHLHGFRGSPLLYQPVPRSWLLRQRLADPFSLLDDPFQAFLEAPTLIDLLPLRLPPSHPSSPSSPHIDLDQRPDGSLVAEVAVGDVPASSLSVDVDQDVLTVRGVVNQTHVKARFERITTLPTTLVENAQLRAYLKDGRLSITIPKEALVTPPKRHVVAITQGGEGTEGQVQVGDGTGKDGSTASLPTPAKSAQQVEAELDTAFKVEATATPSSDHLEDHQIQK